MSRLARLHVRTKLTLVFGQGSPELGALAQVLRDQLRANLSVTIDLQQRETATLRIDTFAQKVANAQEELKSFRAELTERPEQLAPRRENPS